MAALNPGRTNQKLYFARLQQELLEAALGSDDVDAGARALACREAVIFHLHGAYVSLLHELCRFYKLPQGLSSTEALRKAMADKGQVSPEVTVLQQWEASPASWLAGLLAAYGGLLDAADAVKARPLPQDALESGEGGPHLIREIHLVETESDMPLSQPDVARLQAWQQELTRAIREFRREMQEW